MVYFYFHRHHRQQYYNEKVWPVCVTRAYAMLWQRSRFSWQTHEVEIVCLPLSQNLCVEYQILWWWSPERKDQEGKKIFLQVQRKAKKLWRRGKTKTRSLSFNFLSEWLSKNLQNGEKGMCNATFMHTSDFVFLFFLSSSFFFKSPKIIFCIFVPSVC